MRGKPYWTAAFLLTLAGLVTGCNRSDNQAREYAMGEKVSLGPLTYNVIEANWYNQLGEGFNIRSPQQRFMAITVSVTNGGGQDYALPLLTLQNSDGKDFIEEQKGDGLSGWLGLIRNIGPAQTMQGKLLFDVPLGTYKLRVTDGEEAGAEKFGWVNIPLRLDVDAPVQSPTPGGDITK